MRRPASLLLAVSLAALSLVSASPALACFGARPLAMGGAFVAVADDVHATYWNPAGLVKLSGPEVSATFDTDWQDLNYDIFAGVAAPVGSRAGVGLLYVFNEDDLGMGVTRTDHLIQAAGALVLLPWESEAPISFSVGLSGKYLDKDYDISGVSDRDHTVDMDVAFLLDAGPSVAPRQRMFSFGLLLQNVTESSFDFRTMGRQTFATNVRPAAAFRPDALTTLAVEIYDATEQVSDRPGLRLGVERWLMGAGRPLLALRAGAYHINQPELRAYTFGLGLRLTPRSELSYALMYWTQAEQTTHLLAAGYRF